MQTTKRIRQFSQGNKEPQPGDKIVYIDGSFDILHMGHIVTLKEAKKLGDYLIVGLHDDETINRIKGSNYPILSIQERVLNVLAMKYVDEVIIGAPWKITENLIKQFKIDLVVEGSMGKGKEHQINYTQESDPYAVCKKMGIYKSIESTVDITTETIIERIIENRKKYQDIYNKKSKKEDDYYQTTER